MNKSKQMTKWIQLCHISPGQLFHQLGMVRRKKLHHKPQNCVLGALTQKYTSELETDFQAQKYAILQTHESNIAAGSYV